MKSGKLALLAAVGLFVLSAVFRFALVGYATLAWLFAGAGVVVLLYRYLPTQPLRVGLTALLCAGVGIFFAAEIPVIRAARGDPDADADYIIVLGAGVNGTAPSLSLTERLETAQTYLERHPQSVAVVTGGQGAGEDLTEAEVMFRWLTAHGISEERILREPQAKNTRENLKYSFALIPDALSSRVAVVSSEYHLCRAEYLSKQMGIVVSGIPASTSLPLLRINYFIREAFGMAYYRVFG